jgi:hypothetical protein
MELRAINVTIDERATAAPGWLDVDDADDSHTWEPSVRGPIDGDLGNATSGRTEDVFMIELMTSQNRRSRGLPLSERRDPQSEHGFRQDESGLVYELFVLAAVSLWALDGLPTTVIIRR